MSATAFNCTLHEILQTPCGSNRDKESHVLLSECNSDISAHLASCHLSKCGDITEAELIMARAGIRGLSVSQLAGMTICPKHRHSLGRFWRAPRSCQYPGHTGKNVSVPGRHVINFQIADEIAVLFGKVTTAVGSRKYLSPCGSGENFPHCQFSSISGYLLVKVFYLVFFFFLNL